MNECEVVYEFIARLPTFREDMLLAVIAAIDDELESHDSNGSQNKNLYVIRQCSDPAAYGMQFLNQKYHYGILSKHTCLAVVTIRSLTWAEHVAARQTLTGEFRYEVVAIPKKRYFNLPWTDWIDE